MRSYLALMQGAYMGSVIYRLTHFFALVNNLFYIVLVYFLWRGIYKNSAIIHGMTFDQAFVYLALAGSIFFLFKTSADWTLSDNIISGRIIVELVKPLHHPLMMLFDSAGVALFNFIMITLPALALIFVFRTKIDLGIGLAFFPIGLLFAFLISFSFDYVVGLTSFYTESLWGISMTKEVIISLLSGALIPLNFFPPWAQGILQLLPFQAIYHIPLTMFTSPTSEVTEYLRLLAIQVFWVIALSVLTHLFYRKAIQVLTINGG